MMTTESMLSKRPVLRISVTSCFLLEVIILNLVERFSIVKIIKNHVYSELMS